MTDRICPKCNYEFDYPSRLKKLLQKKLSLYQKLKMVK